MLKGRAKTQVRKVAQKLRKASKAHAGQAKTLSKLVKNGTNKTKKSVIVGILKCGRKKIKLQPRRSE